MTIKLEAAQRLMANNPKEAGLLLQALKNALGNNFKKKEDTFRDATNTTRFQSVTWQLERAKVVLSLKTDKFGGTLWFQLSSPDVNIAAGEGKTAKEAILDFVKNAKNVNARKGPRADALRTRDASALRIMNSLADRLRDDL